MKKGFTLIETLISGLIISSLLIFVGIIFIKGAKYKVVALENYDKELELSIIQDTFTSFNKYYMNEQLREENNILYLNNKIVFHKSGNTLYFILDKEVVLDLVSDVHIELLNSHLLKVEVIQNEFHTIFYYYFGGN